MFIVKTRFGVFVFNCWVREDLDICDYCVDVADNVWLVPGSL